MSSNSLPNKRFKQTHGYSVAYESDETRYDRLIEKLESKRNWRPSEDIDMASFTFSKKIENATEDDDTDVHSIFSIPKQEKDAVARPTTAVEKQKTDHNVPPNLPITINDKYSKIEAKSFIASKELSMDRIQDCYEVEEGESHTLVYHNEDSIRNKYPKRIRLEKCFAYIHFQFTEALKLNTDYARIEQIMRSVSTRMKETRGSVELRKLMMLNKQEGIDLPLSISDPEGNTKWIDGQKLSKWSYFVFFRVALQKAVWYTGELVGSYMAGIVINRVTMKDAYIAFRLRDDSQFAILFHFEIARFFSSTAPINPDPLKKSRIWRVITRDEYFGPKQFVTHDLGVINFMTLEYRGYYYVYFNNLKMLLENENYKV